MLAFFRLLLGFLSCHKISGFSGVPSSVSHHFGAGRSDLVLVSSVSSKKSAVFLLLRDQWTAKPFEILKS